MRGCTLLRFPRSRSALRDELARVLDETMPDVVAGWVRQIGPAFGISEAHWPDLSEDIEIALRRWVRHIADPEDCDTYVYLRSHARRGFISKFPASRFLSGQIKVFHLMENAIRRRYADDQPRRKALLALLAQEFEERVLHITDFFVEAREEELREQEATYRRSIDSAPAAIFRIDSETGAILAANFVAEQTLELASEDLRGLTSWDLHPPDERTAAIALWEETRTKGNANRDDLHHRTRSGAVIPMFINSGLIEYGEQRFIQQICVDMSDRQQLEDQLIHPRRWRPSASSRPASRTRSATRSPSS